MDEYGPGEHLLSLVHHSKKGLPGAGEVAEHLSRQVLQSFGFVSWKSFSCDIDLSLSS